MFQVLLRPGAVIATVKALRDLSGMRLAEAHLLATAGNDVVVASFESKDDAEEARGNAQQSHPFLDFRVKEVGEDAPLIEDTEETLPVVCDADLLVPGPPPYDDEPPF